MKKTILLIVISLLAVCTSYCQVQLYEGTDTSVCAGVTIKLMAPAGHSNYVWHSKSGVIPGCLTQNCNQIINASDTFYVTYTSPLDTSQLIIVTIKPNPVASFTSNANSTDCSNIAVSFFSNSSGSISSYLWVFDDPNSGAINMATNNPAFHTFIGSPGSSAHDYFVQLKVTDLNGCSDDTVIKVTRKELPDTTMRSSGISNFFGSTYFTSCSPNPADKDFTFVNFSSTQPDFNYKIFWGDGTANFDSNVFTTVNHSFKPGVDSMLLVVQGTNGCIDTGRYYVLVGHSPNIGTIGSSLSLCSNTTFPFPLNGTDTNSISTIYIINVNDGTPDTIYTHPPPPTFPHAFLTSSCGNISDNGNFHYQNAYAVYINAQNPCGTSGTSAIPIYVSQTPQANFSISPYDTVCLNSVVTLTNTGVGGSAVNSTSCDPGNFIWLLPPEATLVSGDPGTDKGLSDPALWGSGSMTITVKFTTIGTHNIGVKSGGNVSCGIDSFFSPVCVNPEPTNSFATDSDTGCSPLVVHTTTFTNTPTCGKYTYKWNITYSPISGCVPNTENVSYLSNTSDTSREPVFRFNNPGKYTLSSAVFGPGGSCATTSLSKVITVKGIPNVISLSIADSICPGDTILPLTLLDCFIDSSATYKWSFPGGSPDKDSVLTPGAIVYFAGDSTYPIIFEATNSCGSSDDTAYVAVKPLVKILHNPNITICAGDSVPSVVFQSIPAGASFAWTNSDTTIGLDSSASGFIPAFVAKDTGTSPVKSMIIISIQNASCGNPLPDTFYITVLPSIDSSLSDTICQKDLPYLWRNHSLDSTGIYSDTANNSTGCDTIFKLRLTVTKTIQIFDSAIACPAQLPYTWPHNQKQYPADGYYYDTTYTSAGCDTIWSLHLMVSDTLRHIDTVEVCNNVLPYLWHQTSYNTDTLVSFDTTNVVGCDSISYLRLVVKDTTIGTTIAAICSDVLPYVWNGNSYFTTDSLAIVLPGQNQFGCDSTDILILTVKLPTDSNMYVTLCPRDIPYVWPVNGLSYSTTTNVVVIKKNMAGCDSVITLHLTVNLDTRRDTSAAICNNDTLLWRGSNYFLQGNYPFILPNQFGCDSIITLQLTVLDTSFSEKLDTVCSNRLPYTWNNNSYYDSGWHSIRFPGQNYLGCDSIAKLHLFVKDTTATFDTLKICPSQLPYNWEGLILSRGGDTTKRYINRAGCDSIKLLHLIIKNNSYTTVIKELCPRDIPYLWNNVLYTVSGTYQATFLNRDSCDSVVTLHLTVYDNSQSTTDLVVCRDTFPFIWNSLNISSAGVYKTTLIARDEHTCDSIVTLNVAIKPGSARSENYISICPADTPYAWHGLTFTKSGVDSVKISNGSGCDSTAVIIVTLHNNDTVYYTMQLCPAQFPFNYHGNVFATPGTYPVHLQTYFGCDSLVYITLDPRTDSTITEMDSVCVGRFPYYWHNKAIYNAGIYFDTLTNSTGCRTFYTLHLGVVNSPTRIEYVHTCSDKLPFIWHNQPYTISGFYTFTDSISANCDSILQLALTIGNPGTVSLDTTLCPSQLPFSWNNQIASSDTTLKFISQNLEQCDSTTILHVHVSPLLRDTVTVSICSNTFPYSWHSKSYYAAGTYHDTISLSLGCLRVSTLQLLENKISSSDTMALVCKKQTPFIWRSRLYYTSSEDSVKLTNYLGCDSVIYLHLNVAEVDTLPIQSAVCSSQLPYSFNGHVFTSAGTFDTAFVSIVTGCDSVVNRLILTVSSTLPLPPPVSNSPVCEGANIQLRDTLITNAAYYWSGPKQFTSQVSNPLVLNASQQSAGYYVSAITVNGCETKDSVLVTIISKPIGGHTNNDTSVCNGVNAGVIRLTGYSGTIREWQYSIDSGRIWTSVPSGNYDTVAYKNLTSVRWFRAVVGKDSCTDVYSDTSKITLLASANIADAGSPQILCKADSTTLAGNIPANNSTGAWTLVLPSPAVNFYNSTLYNTSVTGLQGDVTYKFAWTITAQGACIATSDTVTIINRPAITKADAGANISVCDFPNTKQADLTSNLDSLRPYETGQWTLINYPAGSIQHAFGNQANPATNFTFDSAGVYTIAWTIKNDIATGCSPSTSTINITVTPSPVSSFSVSQSQTCVGENVTVTNNSRNANPTSFTWIWDDLTPNSTFINGQHSYSIAGNYIVRLVAANASCTDTSEIPITVVNKVPAQIMVGQGAPCVPYTIHLKAANDTSASRIEWKIFDHSAFPAVSVITGATALYTFNFAGSDSVRLIVYSSNGCKDSAIYKFTVYDIPSVSFTPMAYDTCSHDEVLNFTATPSQPGTDSLHYTWFVDTVIKGNTNPFSYRFITSPANPDVVVYHIQALAQNEGQCGDTSLTGIVIIKPLPAIAINVEPSRRQEEPNFTFTFSDTSAADSVTTYKWFTGDRSAQVRDGQRITYTYSDTGKYTVSLLKTNLYTCTNTDTVQIQILPVRGYIYVPNAMCVGCQAAGLRTFLPLGKGLSEYHLRIYTTWGQLVFQTDSLNLDGSPAVAWDGTWTNAKDGAKGAKLQQNTYIWTIDAKYINKSEWKGMVYPGNSDRVKTGFITIIK